MNAQDGVESKSTTSVDEEIQRLEKENKLLELENKQKSASSSSVENQKQKSTSRGKSLIGAYVDFGETSLVVAGDGFSSVTTSSVSLSAGPKIQFSDYFSIGARIGLGFGGVAGFTYSIPIGADIMLYYNKLGIYVGGEYNLQGNSGITSFAGYVGLDFDFVGLRFGYAPYVANGSGLYGILLGINWRFQTH